MVARTPTAPAAAFRTDADERQRGSALLNGLGGEQRKEGGEGAQRGLGKGPTQHKRWQRAARSKRFKPFQTSNGLKMFKFFPNFIDPNFTFRAPKI
jgi:hypothetical protein